MGHNRTNNSRPMVTVCQGSATPDEGTELRMGQDYKATTHDACGVAVYARGCPQPSPAPPAVGHRRELLRDSLTTTSSKRDSRRCSSNRWSSKQQTLALLGIRDGVLGS